MTNTSAAVVRSDCSFSSVMKVVLNYAGAYELHFFISFEEAFIRGIVDDIMPLRYLLKQFRLSCIQYVRFRRLMTNNAAVLSLLESLNESQTTGKSWEYCISAARCCKLVKPVCLFCL